MFKRSIFGATNKLIRGPIRGRVTPASLLTNFRPQQSLIGAGIRFKSTAVDSTTQSGSEIQTTLPSFDELNDIVSSAGVTDQMANTVSDACNEIGYLNSIGMAQTWWWPADLVQHMLEYVHVYTGLPWWGTICTVTILVRLLMFPLYVKSSDTMARNSQIKPELDKINQELMSTTELADGQRVALKRKQLLAKHGIKNRWLVAPMLQMPLALGFFGGIRHMANYPVSGFTDQGILWFTDLSQADPYIGLQVITSMILISFTRMGGETGAQQFSPNMKKFFTILPLLSIPATMNLSSGVVLYFAVNSAFSILQTSVLRNKTLRKKLNIADIVVHDPSTTGPKKGIMETFRDNMAKSKAQAERRQKMQLAEKEKQELAKQNKANSKIKIVHRSQFKKNNTFFYLNDINQFLVYK
ncbi:hypothetical protein TPHA_0D04380 [Tetrapisispora phaffii CBS 4417]|uniref:Membrane insertase YidC/Oxa/ALB C-terminal domain-containing protein n=1 Tax=Tetrapisispora phaffii (strain ATCC 24235 / CBS 4417 / NBRC 1672 / NRRL Y-8282 / UCD 70-5) TaxID=1071381 RepID=G8BRZ7_TETPH|nr:hypothetical protein TPHA_0D04380 [Tetrapisispora phaffii CBS 4417]CCE63072.1 hypothetical protein TPHA_0D04380 [Tetrapisispora phaffii CBS 4417]